MSPRKLPRDWYEPVIIDYYVPDNGMTEESCPKCGKKARWSRDARGRFLVCSAPKCDWELRPAHAELVA